MPIFKREAPDSPRHCAEQRRPTRNRGLLFAIAVVIAVTLLRLELLSALGMRAAFLLFYPAVMVAALYGGLQPGLLATFLSAAVADYFWLEPAYSLRAADPVDWLSLAIFVGNGLLISWIAEKVHRSNLLQQQTEASHRAELERLVAERTAELTNEIAERKRTEAALLEREQRLEGFLDNSAVFAWLKDEDGRYQFLSQSFVRSFGDQFKNYAGKTDYDLWPQAIADQFLENDRVVIAAGRSLEAVESASIQEGKVIWCHVNRFSYRDAFGRLFVGGLAVDISARIQAEETLRDSEERYRVLHEGLRDAFAKVDMDGRFTEFNAVFHEMLGYEPDELRKLTYQDLTPERWRAFEDDIVQTQILPRGFSDVYEKEYRRKDGSVAPIELRTILLRLCASFDGRTER